MKVCNLRQSPEIARFEAFNCYNISNSREMRYTKIENKEVSYIKRELFLINPRVYKENALKNVNEIVYKGKRIEDWKDIRISKLNEILNVLKNKNYNIEEVGELGFKKFKYNKEIDRKESIKELEELINFIRNITFDKTDSTSEFICKLYLILNKADSYSFSKKLNGKLSEIRTFRKKGDIYVRGLDKALFFPYISTSYGADYFTKAILYEYNKKTDLGVHAHCMKLRSERSCSRVNNWRSNETIGEYLSKEQNLHSVRSLHTVWSRR